MNSSVRRLYAIRLKTMSNEEIANLLRDIRSRQERYESNSRRQRSHTIFLQITLGLACIVFAIPKTDLRIQTLFFVGLILIIHGISRKKDD